MSSDRLISALTGGVVGFVLGKFIPTQQQGTNYNDLANLLGTVAPVAPIAAAWGYGRGHAGHGHGISFIDYDKERRLASVEAEQAANAVAIRKDAEISAIRDRYAAEVTEGKIYRATCHKVDGELYVPPRRIGNGYREEPRFIGSHPAEHCGHCGHWY